MRFCLSFLLICQWLTLFASQYIPVDSIKVTTLDDIVIEGDNQYTNSIITTYFPDNNQKDIAVDCSDLINRMGIPQISSQPNSNSFKTNTGIPVKLYVDGHPANAQEMTGINPKNVVKVEFIDHPSDARFQNEQYVLNITLKQVVIGGYTRLYETYASSFGNLSDINNQANIYSRFFKDKFTFDISLYDNYNISHNNSYTKKEIFDLPGITHNEHEVTREEEIVSSKEKNNNISAVIRFLVENKKYTIDNSIVYMDEHSPGNFSNGKLSIYPLHPSESESSKRLSNNSRNFIWNGFYYFQLPKKWGISISPQLSYSEVDKQSVYKTSIASFDFIDNQAKANMWSGNL